MDKKVIDELTVYLEDKTGDDAYELFNNFVTQNNSKFSFEESIYLVELIQRLLRLDKRILQQTINIIKDGK